MDGSSNAFGERNMRDVGGVGGCWRIGIDLSLSTRCFLSQTRFVVDGFMRQVPAPACGAPIERLVVGLLLMRFPTDGSNKMPVVAWSRSSSNGRLIIRLGFLGMRARVGAMTLLSAIPAGDRFVILAGLLGLIFVRNEDRTFSSA